MVAEGGVNASNRTTTQNAFTLDPFLWALMCILYILTFCTHS